MKHILRITKKLLGKNITRKIRPFGHGLKGYCAAAYFGFPGKKLKIIGVNGTKGKTTTTVIAGRLANEFGVKTGYISTAVINTQSKNGEFLNPYKMTTIDAVSMHRYLKEMVKNGCKIAVIEMSSQGLEQNRHIGLGGFDTTLFLNIYPEHIEAHGSWEKYVQAKSILYKNIKPNGVFIGNEDFPETEIMYGSIPDEIEDSITKILFSTKQIHSATTDDELNRSLVIDTQLYPTNFTTSFDIHNCFVAMLAVAYTTEAKVSSDEEIISLAKLLKNVHGVPGRMDWVLRNGKTVENQESTSKDLANTSIIVDYAHEPASMEQLLSTLQSWKKSGHFSTIIHLVSCDGAGRDDWKKPVLGDLSMRYADFSIFTTDNYDESDDPQAILDMLSENAIKKEQNNSYYKVINRKKAMEKAIEIAKSYSTPVLIVSTGVGSEQGLSQPGGTIKWDERDVWRQLIS
jgi:UDP-N-acetylmuramoyl-L-alanyl-D-glutamate--2,6-diaminopimelate ligase